MYVVVLSIDKLTKSGDVDMFDTVGAGEGSASFASDVRVQQ